MRRRTTRSSPRGIETFYCAGSSQSLAASVQRALVEVGQTSSRSLKLARFFVLRKCRTRAMLIKCGFLTNRENAALAGRPDYRERLATAIAAAAVFHAR